jgi:outer membrane protein assembly factor BamD (BamD/ComL family)
MLYKFVFLFFSSLFFFSCNSNNTTDEKSAMKDDTSSVKVDECVTLLKQVKHLDSILQKSTAVNNDIADKAITTFDNFSSTCNTDSLAPIFLIKAGQVAQSIKKYEQAQSLFKKCINQFTDFKNRGAALFLLAQLYDNEMMLNNEAEAKIIYEQIIKEYPQSPFANDAKYCIKNIGKTDEQLVQEFLKKNK